MAGTDKSVDLYKLLTGFGKKQGAGIKIVRVITAEPDPLTFIFEGTKLALDPDVFEIPVDLYPIKEGDRFMAYPMLNAGAATRWALLQKLNGCKVNLATMQGPSSLLIDGITKQYTADRLVVPAGLETGDRVAISAVYDGGVIKYAVLHVFK